MTRPAGTCMFDNENSRLCNVLRRCTCNDPGFLREKIANDDNVVKRSRVQKGVFWKRSSRFAEMFSSGTVALTLWVCDVWYAVRYSRCIRTDLQRETYGSFLIKIGRVNSNRDVTVRRQFLETLMSRDSFNMVAVFFIQCTGRQTIFMLAAGDLISTAKISRHSFSI